MLRVHELSGNKPWTNLTRESLIIVSIVLVKSLARNPGNIRCPIYCIGAYEIDVLIFEVSRNMQKRIRAEPIKSFLFTIGQYMMNQSSTGMQDPNCKLVPLL
jgi:hypothetical protein